MTIAQVIIALCSFLPVEQVPICEERVTACYEKHVEITNEEPKAIVKLCFGTYTDNWEKTWPKK